MQFCRGHAVVHKYPIQTIRWGFFSIRMVHICAKTHVLEAPSFSLPTFCYCFSKVLFNPKFSTALPVFSPYCLSPKMTNLVLAHFACFQTISYQTPNLSTTWPPKKASLEDYFSLWCLFQSLANDNKTLCPWSRGMHKRTNTQTCYFILIIAFFFTFSFISTLKWAVVKLLWWNLFTWLDFPVREKRNM